MQQLQFSMMELSDFIKWIRLGVYRSIVLNDL